MKYFFFILSCLCGFYTPAIVINITIYFQSLPFDNPDNMTPFFLDVFFGGTMWALIISGLIGFALLFSKIEKLHIVGAALPFVCAFLFSVAVLIFYA